MDVHSKCFQGNQFTHDISMVAKSIQKDGNVIPRREVSSFTQHRGNRLI